MMRVLSRKIGSFFGVEGVCLTSERLYARILQRRRNNRIVMSMTNADDAVALQRDWRNVGLDIMESIQRFANEQ